MQKGRTRAWHGLRTPFRRRVGRVTARPHGAPGAPSLTKIRLFVRQDEFPFETLSGGEGEKRVRGGKSGGTERGFARGPSSKRRSLYHRTWGFGVAHGAPHRDRSDPFVPIGARGVGPLARGFSARARIVGNSTPLTALRGGTSKNRVGNKLGRNDPKSGVRLDAGDPRKDNFPAHGVGHRVENRFRSDEVCREPKRTNSLQNVRKSRHDIQKVGRDFPSQRISINHRREFEGLSGGRSGTFFAFGKPFFVPSRPHTDS